MGNYFRAARTGEIRARDAQGAFRVIYVAKFADAMAATLARITPWVAPERRARRTRGPGKKPAKVSTTLRLPRETLARWKASGPGWQTRMAQILERRAP